MKRVIQLTDGPHVVTAPTYYALQLMHQNGIDVFGGGFEMNAATLPTILACLLTDSEPLDDKKQPVREWSPIEVAKLFDIDKVQDYMLAASELIVEAFKDSEEGANRPNSAAGQKPRPRSKKP